MKMIHLQKSLSILISASLLASTFQPAFAAPVAPAAPDFVSVFTPPARLGYVDSFYKGNTDKPVVLIEDLHANYGVQKNIEGMLSQFQASQGNKPLVIGMEAASGPQNLSYLKNVNSAVKAPVLEFLLKQAEITAPAHFMAVSQKPVELIGIDNRQDYLLHRDLVRKSMVVRLNLADQLDAMVSALQKAKKSAPRDLKKIWKIEEAYRSGSLELTDLAQALHTGPLANYGEAEKALSNAKIAIADKNGSKELSSLIKADQDLALLSRLLRQQLTLEEVQYVAGRLPEITVELQVLDPKADLEASKETIRAALDYYAIALLRDKPLAANTYTLAQSHPDRSIVIVTGGFHTAAIQDYLKTRNVSYVTLAPVVQSHTFADEELYLHRLLGDHVTRNESRLAARQWAASAHTLGTEQAGPDVVKDVVEGTDEGLREMMRVPVTLNGEPIFTPKVGSSFSFKNFAFMRYGDIITNLPDTELTDLPEDKHMISPLIPGQKYVAVPDLDNPGKIVIATQEIEIIDLKNLEPNKKDSDVIRAFKSALAEQNKEKGSLPRFRAIRVRVTADPDLTASNAINIVLRYGILDVAINPRVLGSKVALKLVANQEVAWAYHPKLTGEKGEAKITQETLVREIRQNISRGQAQTISAVRMALEHLELGVTGGVSAAYTVDFLLDLMTFFEQYNNSYGEKGNLHAVVASFVTNLIAANSGNPNANLRQMPRMPGRKAPDPETFKGISDRVKDLAAKTKEALANGTAAAQSVFDTLAAPLAAEIQQYKLSKAQQKEIAQRLQDIAQAGVNTAA